MARNTSGFFVIFFLFFFVSLVSRTRGAETQQQQGAFTRVYVVQPGPGPGPGSGPGHRDAVRVSSIATSTRHTHAHSGAQSRTRRMGTQQNHNQKQVVNVSGVNVCGGQCCHGWSKTQVSQRCTSPNCVPQCQNGGMCLKPQFCICKPGSEGKHCEQQTASEPTNGHTNVQTHGHTPGLTNGHTTGQNVVPQRPIPQQVVPGGYVPGQNNMAQMKLTVKPAPQIVRPHYIQQHIQQQIRPVPVHPGQSQQYVLKPKYYHQPHVQPQPGRPIPLSLGHNPLHVGNHTGRIKVVFTPTICKLTCVGGSCHNNCELGNTTTIISENGRSTDTLTAPNFRVVVCHLPCINGGKCSFRDKCQCPPSFTGKFCQMHVQSGAQLQQQGGTTGGAAAGGYLHSQVHTTHTLPLTYSNGHTAVFNPSFVNIHIKHPPEASVQVHQVSQLDNGHSSVSGSSSSSSSYSYHRSESSQKVQHHGYNVLYPGHHYQVQQFSPVSKNTLGRCFQETSGSQCGKVLPGLTKQEQCCNSIGTSWGFHKCQKCPQNPSIPLIDCPQGYKRVNSSHCHDFDECQVQGVCPDGNCVNTVGSYRCLCKPGFMPDSTLTSCLPESLAVSEEKGACFRLVGSGRQCLHPVSAQLSRQLCCCSVGKAWGPRCDRCPSPGTAKFKEICPGGMGYTVLPNPPFHKPVHVPQEPVEPPLPLPTPERPVEAFDVTDEPLPEVIEKTSPPAPVEILPSNAGQEIAPTQSAEVDECQINPYICGQGVCYNTPQGYICHCDEGYRHDDQLHTCTDVDECEESLALCSGGRCRNTEGSFLCDCPPGFTVDEDGTSCVDIDECLNRTLCPSGICYNAPGGFTCGSCPGGFQGRGGHCEDIDECADQRVCTRGHCVNTEGSFRCQCGPGFRASPSGHQCDDENECLESNPCGAGECVNNVGSYSCQCPSGFREGFNQDNITSCTDVDECVQDSDLCSPHGECLNTEGSYQCVCESGFTTSLHSPSCDDIDECGLNETLCGPYGFCENRLGSYRCLCDQGYQESADGRSCLDVNECALLSSVCGEAECVNMDGSFLCVCPSGQEYNVMVAKCEALPTVSSVERKECYFRLNDENLCESVLTSSVTLEECCCTLGAGWGDNCEVHPCPVNGTDQFNQMCPSGRGFVPAGDSLYGVPSKTVYKDAEECQLFGQEVCKGGFCLDTEGSYECYCKTGQDYDPQRLECRDINECLDESVCTGGECLNTDGSFMCFCTHPMTLDSSRNQCVFSSDVPEPQEMENVDFQGVCWQVVTESMTCTEPLGPDRKTTYTECCCLYGEAWGMECALCPPTNTEDYASMCNLPVGAGRRPYGRDALVAGPVHEYEVSPDYSPTPDQLYNEQRSVNAFEGLQAEECGILNGCENGRCVRVQEGYTCDCFDGFTLDLSRMACIDVNECSELNRRMSLCKNAQCINSVGSYRCECLPGFVPSEKPNYCIEETPQQQPSHSPQRRRHKQRRHAQ